MTLFTDSVGSRIIEIFNDDLSFFFQQEVYLENEMNVIDLNVEIPIGEYTITTNSDFNNQQFGVVNPYLWRSPQNILYPYAFQDIMAITNSTFGADYYYYFYDWKVSTPDMYCGSELVPATAVLDLETATLDIDPELEFVVSPNPTSGACYLALKADGVVDVELRNMEGVLIQAEKNLDLGNRPHQLDLTNYPSGVYLIRVVQENRFFTKKIIRL